MTIAHDCYPFLPDKFAATVSPYVEALKHGPDGYSKLRSAALTLFDNDSNVRRLVSDYGGWNKRTLEAEPPETTPGFWLMLFLYAHFFTVTQKEPSLNVPLSTVAWVARLAGWSKDDVATLNQGKHSFKDFARQWLFEELGDNPQSIPDFWNHFHPESTLGHLGWLNVADIRNLLKAMSALEPTIANMNLGDSDPNKILRHFACVKNVFQGAVENDYCLCVVTSA